MLVPIDQVRTANRLRGLREATVAELVDSIGRLGLRVPVSVTSGIEKRKGDADGVSFTLVAGAHRLEACKRLGWTEIEAAVVQMDDDECLLWEIDENLCRAELTELERGEHLLKRKEIYERKWPQTKQHVAGGHARQETAGDNLSFAEDTAAKADIDQRTVQRSIRRARKIDEKVRDRVRAIPEIADSGVELDALAELDPAQQRRAIALVEGGQAYGIRDAKRLMEPKRQAVTPSPKAAQQVEDKQFAALMRAWNGAGSGARERFLAEIEDRT